MATCRCDHTEKAHTLSWSVVPCCAVVWCRCNRFRDADAGLMQRWSEWRAWRRKLREHERGNAPWHRLGRPRC